MKNSKLLNKIILFVILFFSFLSFKLNAQEPADIWSIDTLEKTQKKTENNNFEEDFKFVRDVGITFQMLFNKIIRKKLKKKWTKNDKELQYIKRGRYAEFNLLYDRGTKFGLQTGGNVEGILMSLPPLAKW